jgi:hypothetical protein
MVIMQKKITKVAGRRLIMVGLYRKIRMLPSGTKG